MYRIYLSTETRAPTDWFPCRVIDSNSSHKRSITCHLCEAMCGLELHVTDDEVKLIRPNRTDIWSKGHICPKGTTLGKLAA